MSGIQSTASTQTEWMLSDAMIKDMEKQGTDFRQLRQRPMTIYVCMDPEEISRKRRWTRVVIASGSIFRMIRRRRCVTEGRYKLDVFAHLLGEQKPTQLFSQVLEVTHDIATALKERSAGVYFDWGPDSSRYLSHVDKRPPSPDADEFLRMLGIDKG